MLYGALIGDIVGSRFERHPIKTTKFELFHPDCRFTDDTVMSFAVADAIEKIKSKSMNADEVRNTFISYMQKYGKQYPNAGYGNTFCRWLASSNPQPYNSFGNGSAMRVSPIAWKFDNLFEVEAYARASAEVSHNHPEGIKGAVVTAGCIFLAKTRHNKDLIVNYVKMHDYILKPLNQIRHNYKFDVSCQGSVPIAIEAFLESETFEQAIRLAISMGGDADTLGAIAGSIAEAYYNVPKSIILNAEAYLPIELRYKLYDLNGLNRIFEEEKLQQRGII